MQERAIGGWLAAAGSLGVVVITAIYASVPPEASAPLPPGASFGAVLAATLTASAKRRLAGTIGIVADIVLIAGCALLAMPRRSRRRSECAANAVLVVIPARGGHHLVQTA